MKKLAIIGASYLQEPIVRKAKEMGIYTICFAWREGATCADICDKFYPVSIIDKEQVLEICQKEQIDGITTIASDTATITVNYVASRMGLISNPVEYSEIYTNKYKMRRCLMDNGVPSPRFALADSADTTPFASFQYPLIVKPTDRSGSRGVEKVETPERLEKAIARAQGVSFEHKAIVEEFITGCEVSVESISYKGQHTILQMTDKVTSGAPYFVELAHHQPSALPADVQARIRSIVLYALDALHIRYGASHSELKITESGDICVIEIGARMGGDFIGSHLVQRSTGYDFVKGVIDIALGHYNPPCLTKANCSGVYFLCRESASLLPMIRNAAAYPEIIEAKVLDAELHPAECSADRSGYLIYQASKRLTLSLHRATGICA